MAGKILREQSICLRTCQRFLDVIAVFRSWTRNSEERGGELHLRIKATKLDGLFHEGVAVDSLCGVVGVAEPLFEGFGEIADIKIIKSGRSTGLRRLRPRGEHVEEISSGGWILAGVQRGAADRFHVDEHGGIRSQDGEGIRGKFCSVVGLAAGEVPVVAYPWQGFRGADFKGVADERRSGEGEFGCGGQKRQ
jgi:hypothetical protein